MNGVAWQYDFKTLRAIVYYQIFYIFTHFKFCLTHADHKFKWVRIYMLYRNNSEKSKYNGMT